MATSIVDGLFGPTPDQLRQQQQEAINQQAMQYARMAPLERASMGMYQAGAGLARPVAGMLGGVNPQEQQALRAQQVMSEGDTDLSTSKGLLAKAEQFRKAGDLRTATMLALKGKEVEKDEQSAALAARKQEEDIQFKRDQLVQNAELKRMQLEQVAEAARLRSEDSRYSADQRAEAAREATAARLQLGQLMAEIRKLRIESKITDSPKKPKGLTREAGLKWELENGMIDQATYDAALAASPAGKLVTAKNEAAQSAEQGFSSITRNIEKLYDPKSKTLTESAKPLFGQYAQYRPDWSQSQDTVDANAALESLTNQVMLTNLADAKTRVGQSFGSMQVQEWDKFTQQLTSLKRGLSEKAAAEAMQYVLNFIKTKRNVLNTAMNTPNPISSPPPAAKGVWGKAQAVTQ